MDNWIENIASRQPALTEHDRRLRDDFVEQYFLDHNPIRAVIRLGYNKSYAEHMSQQFMLDSYVLNEIERRKLIPRCKKAQLKEWISAELMSRATYEGPGASETAKIAALKVLIDLHELSKLDSTTPNSEESLFNELQELSQEEFETLCLEKGLVAPLYDYGDVAE